jgi:hypothetical protein
MPAILLEGDEPVRSASPPPPPPAAPVADDIEAGDFPEALGTGKLLLIPRDPACLYAAWDFTAEQQRQANAKSVRGHLVLHIWRGGTGRQLVSEIQVHPESRHWFAHVAEPGEVYSAELGYYDTHGHWRAMAASGEVRAPGGALPPSPGKAEYITSEVLPVTADGQPTHHASESPAPVEVARPSPSTESPPIERSPAALEHCGVSLPGDWTEAHSREIAEISGASAARVLGLGSLESVELASRQAAQPPTEGGVSSLEAARSAPSEGIPSAQAPPPPGSIEAAGAPPEEQQRGFWFQVNAELVVYGATDPRASVAIGGCRIRLRADGSFSYRFALPDGQFQLPIEATSADGELRRASMSFSRHTQASGRVETHPQDPSLLPPKPESVS